MEHVQSEQINELVAAIVRAQLKMIPASRDHVNPYFKSKYADLPSCWEAVACFQEEGVAITQSPMEGPDGFLILDTQLSHISGQWMRSRLKIRVVKDDPQGYGSAITYARRYALGCMTGLVTEADDDGNAASTPPPQRTVGTAYRQPVAQAKIAELRQEMTKPEPLAAGHASTTPAIPTNGTGGQAVTPHASAESAPALSGDDPAAPYRRALGTTGATNQAVNAWWRSVPEELKQDLFDDYKHALKEAGKK